jgi:hypothetical protein
MITGMNYNSAEQHLLIGMINIILFIIIVSILPININIKIIIVSLIITVFKRNLNILCKIINIISINKNILSKSNIKLRMFVTNILEENFIFSHNFHELPSYPSIIVSNYCYDRLENIACITIPKNISIIMGELMVKYIKLNSILENIICKNGNKYKGGEYDHIKSEIKKCIENGISTFSYVSASLHKNAKYIGKLRSGMFRIAKDLNIPITPIFIDYIDDTFGIIPLQNFRMHVGETFLVGEDMEEDIYNTRKFFVNQMTISKNTKFKL